MTQAAVAAAPPTRRAIWIATALGFASGLPGAAAAIHHATRRGVAPTTWLGSMLARKPRMLVTVALANKMARIVWALLVNGEEYQAPARAVA